MARTLKIGEAATLLAVSPSTLRTWERRFDYPHPQRSAGQQRVYSFAEVEALRAALEAGLSVSSAVSAARDDSNPQHDLRRALRGFRLDGADRAMEASLGLHAVEHSVECVLLPSLDAILAQHGCHSATWAFSTGWARSWATRAGHMARLEATWPRLIIGDATGSHLDPDVPYLLAFELFCVRAAASVLTLPVSAAERLRDAVAEPVPDAAIVAGGGRPAAEVAAWVAGIRRSTGGVPFAFYRCPPPLVPRSGVVLPARPGMARQRLMGLIGGHRNGA
jgi:DNA-binding transcriptional MerR regulator